MYCGTQVRFIAMHTTLTLRSPLPSPHPATPTVLDFDTQDIWHSRSANPTPPKHVLQHAARAAWQKPNHPNWGKGVACIAHMVHPETLATLQQHLNLILGSSSARDESIVKQVAARRGHKRSVEDRTRLPSSIRPPRPVTVQTGYAR